MFYGIGIILKVAVLMSILSIASGKVCSRFRTATLAKPEKWKNSDCGHSISENVVATNARSSIQCSSICLQRFPECNSVRYDKASKLCELLACMLLPKRENKMCVTYGINLSHDCSEILKTSPSSQSGVYPITNNDETKTWPVYCDMDTDGGGWTKRQSNSADFNRPWVDYKNGFGSMCDFWLGNDLIHQITASGEYSLRLDMTTETGEVYFATYASFTINGESEKYRLELGNLAIAENAGKASTDPNAIFGKGFKKIQEITALCVWDDPGDVLLFARGRAFSTNDRDNDNHNSKHCAMLASGGWWYSSCFLCPLNGLFNDYFKCSINGAEPMLMLSNSEMKIKRQ